MAEIHIPDEVVEAAAAVLLGRVNAPENAIYAASRAALTAALTAWVECGMAREGAAYMAASDVRQIVASNDLGEMELARTGRREHFPVLIIKTTEAT